ncbi:hypothetical protein SBRY_20207 [Actinacidiphila bryophytorum]|uniref:Uncharacterized protein n=1 Tax=Actinacidiphila bryophytorum TaxID=1436133 RepID=A0A9W4GZE7_9ACTN|nr:hypothetical protein SBRY_20207 [Actinacidiphila bryophytorum]
MSRRSRCIPIWWFSSANWTLRSRSPSLIRWFSRLRRRAADAADVAPGSVESIRKRSSHR